MAKLSLNNITSGFASNTALNANFDAIEAALENTVSRDGTTPNQMTADLDMNGNRILNALADSGDGFVYEGGWTTSTAYTTNDLVYVPVGTGSSYDGFTLICKVAHTSGTLNTDYSAGKWGVIAARGASGGGSGDLVSTNNLSDVANAAIARGNLSAAKSGANSDITSLTALTEATFKSTYNMEAGVDYLGYVAPGISGNVLTSNGTAWGSAAPAVVVAWVTFNSSGTILESYGITSVAKTTTGTYTITFPAFSNAYYAISGSCGPNNTATNNEIRAGTKTTTTAIIYTYSNNAAIDFSETSVVFHGKV